MDIIKGIRRVFGGAAILAVITLPLMLLTGCALKDRLTGDYLNSPKRQKEAIKYLNERYGTEFEYLEDKPYEVGSGNVFGAHGNSVHMYVTCKELPGKKIFVVGSEGSGTYSSNYTALKYEDETMSVLNDIAKSVYGSSAKVFWEGQKGERMGDLEKDATLDDFLRSGSIGFISVLTDKNDDLRGDFRRLVDALTERGVDAKPQSYHYSDASLYADMEKLVYDPDITKEQKVGRCAIGYAPGILDPGFDFDRELMMFDTFL